MIETETSRGRRPVTSEALVFAVRPRANQASRCSRRQKRCPGYDGGDGIRRWRSLDLGTAKAYLRAAAPRAACPEHGAVVATCPGRGPAPATPGRLRTPARG
ncbi:transposase family protein [Candidatus Mycobacterium methanotrophicum]